MLLKALTLSGIILGSIHSMAFADSLDSPIVVRVQSVLGDCSQAAQACGRLYGEILTATIDPIEQSCNRVSSGCGSNLCRHKVNMRIVDQAKASLDPEYEEVNGIIQVKISASFTFSHEKTKEISCEWPGSYDDVKFVAKETWIASNCTAAVTKICTL